jgi:hypothetical protein
MRLCQVPALATAEGQTFPVAVAWRSVCVHGGSDWAHRYRRRPPFVAGASDSPSNFASKSRGVRADRQRGPIESRPVESTHVGSFGWGQTVSGMGHRQECCTEARRPWPQPSAQSFDCSRIAALLSEWQQPIYLLFLSRAMYFFLIQMFGPQISLWRKLENIKYNFAIKCRSHAYKNENSPIEQDNM